VYVEGIVQIKCKEVKNQKSRLLWLLVLFSHLQQGLYILHYTHIEDKPPVYGDFFTVSSKTAFLS